MIKRVMSIIIVLIMVMNCFPICNAGFAVAADNSDIVWNEETLEYIREQVVDYANEIEDYPGEIKCFEHECVERDKYISMVLRYSHSEEELEEIRNAGGMPSANVYWADVTVDKSTGAVSGFEETWYVDLMKYSSDITSDVGASVSFAGGDGTAENPYQVANAEQLNAVRNDLDAHYIQVNDIDLSAYPNWEPIGNGDENGNTNGIVYPFVGTYNGNEYDISNLIITKSEHRYVGLFGYAPDSTLTNINLTNVNINLNYSNIDYTVNWGHQVYDLYLGGIAGVGNKIDHCSTAGNISVANSHDVVIGGIAGNGEVRRSINRIDIDVKSNRDGRYENDSVAYVGGIIGMPPYISCEIVYCINYGNIELTAGRTACTGGIVGKDGKTSYCANYGKISGIITFPISYATTGANCVGGISGAIGSYASVDNCVNYGDIYSYASKTITSNSCAGGIVSHTRGFSINIAERAPITRCYNLSAYITSIGNKKEEDNYIEAFSSASRISTSIDSELVNNCYSINTTLLNGQIPTEDIGENQENGASMNEAEINQKANEILDIINAEINNIDIKFEPINNNSSLSETYTATYIGENGEVICTNTLNVGETAKYDTNTYGVPKSSDEYSKFIGWGVNRSDVIPQSETYKGEYGDITYYALFQTETCNIKWYNGETLLKEENIPKGTIPQYKSEIPKSYDYEIGIVREFLGWTESDNNDYDITIPSAIKNVYTDMVYYTVFSENTSATIDENITYQDIKDIDYINQHILSARQKYWTKFNYTSQAKQKMQENPPLEVASGVWSGVELTVDVINFEIGDIADKITANDYNVIMLEMFNAVENSGMSNDIWNDAVMDSLDEYLKGVKATIDTQKLTNSMVGIEELEEISMEIDEIHRKYDKMQYINPQTAVARLYEDMSNFEIKHNKAMENIELDLKGLTVYKDVASVAEDGMEFVSTMADYLEKMENIVAAKAYINMDETYRQILLDMYAVASKHKGNTWEIADLKHAIVYSLQYYENYEGKAVRQLLSSTIGSITDLSSSMLINDILEDRTINYIVQAFGVTSEVAGSVLAGLQAGSQLGMLLSDAIFDTSKQQDMYVKIKEYGVLQEVMRIVVDDRANKLLSSDDIPDQYDAALAYDKSYKMYMYIEASGCIAVAQYEKSFELPKEIKRYMQKWIGADAAYWLAAKESKNDISLLKLLKMDFKKDTLGEAALRHVQNSEDYIRYVNELKSLSCHEDGNIIEEQFVQILDDYNNNMLNVEKKTYIISCPVEVQMFDKSEKFIGAISSDKYDIPKELQMYIYRVEETDSNVVTVPDDYIVKIKGLDDGEMSIISGEFADGNLINASAVKSIPISSEYYSKVDVSESGIVLYDYNTMVTNYFITTSVNPVLVVVYSVGVVAFSVIGFVLICIKKFKRG